LQFGKSTKMEVLRHTVTRQLLNIETKNIYSQLMEIQTTKEDAKVTLLQMVKKEVYL